jgi:hypothetical protein
MYVLKKTLVDSDASHKPYSINIVQEDDYESLWLIFFKFPISAFFNRLFVLFLMYVLTSSIPTANETPFIKKTNKCTDIIQKHFCEHLCICLFFK